MSNPHDDRSHDSADELYTQWLAELLDQGRSVPSVRDPLSKASDFGQADRPYIELLATVRHLRQPRRCIMGLARPRLHVPYCFAYMSWFLMGREDVATLAYYRPSAQEFSDDGTVLCGSFGRRLFGHAVEADQIAALLTRIRADPASRRLYAPIIHATDNLAPGREYPCAAGVHFFLRDGRLDLVLSMRAQQALTILPYDLFIFAVLQLALASELGVPPGIYSHFASTFHIYLNEIAVAKKVVDVPASAVAPLELPTFPEKLLSRGRYILDDLETGIRQATLAGDVRRLEQYAATEQESDLYALAKSAFLFTACTKLKIGEPLWRAGLPTKDWASLLEGDRTLNAS